MLLKLVRFELKKQLGNKFFLVALCLLLAVNVLLNCGIDEYADIKATLEEAGMTFDVDYWQYRKSNAEMTADSRERYALIVSEGEAFAAAMGEKYGESTFDPFAAPSMEMQSLPGYFGEKWTDSMLIQTYLDLEDRNGKLQTALDAVAESAKAYGREALAKGDHYGVRRNLQIIKLYTLPRGQITSPVMGWDDYLFDSPAMLLVFLLVLLGWGGSFAGEQEKQTVLLLHTAKNGKGKTLAAKYLAGMLNAAGLTVVFQAVTLGTVWYKEGLLGMPQPAAAMELLRLLPYSWRAWQYALVHLGCQIFAAAALSVVVNTISAFSKTSVIAYAAAAVVLGLLLLAGFFDLAEPLTYFDSFNTANVFGFPVLRCIVHMVLWAMAGGMCVYAAHRVFHRKGRVV